MKRLLALLLCLVMALSLIPAAAAEDIEIVEIEEEPIAVIDPEAEAAETAAVNGSVTINAANFPDDNFRSYVSDHFDANGDGVLSASEIANATYIECVFEGIHSLEGIEYLTALNYLCFEYNSVYSVDLSNNKELVHLDASNTSLSSLDVSQNTKLEYLGVGNTPLTSLDISKNTALRDFYSQYTEFEVLDVSNCPGLLFLITYGERLEHKGEGPWSISYEYMFDEGDEGTKSHKLWFDWGTTLIYKPTITTQPKSQTVSEGSTAKFTVKATGATGYRWQYRTSSTGSWNNCTSATAGYNKATLQVSATKARNGYQYRCKVSNAAASVTSSTVTLTVKSTTVKPTITTQPKSAKVYVNTTASFTVAADGAASYQWYYRTSSSGSWAKSTTDGNTTKTLKIKGTTARNGYQYRCKVSNEAGYVYTNAATLTVTDKPVITTQPKSQTVDLDKTVYFTVTANGASSYQWYYRKSETGEWLETGLSGCTTATLKVTAKSTRDGWQFRCKVSNAKGYAYSNAATLTLKKDPVTEKPVIVTQPKSATARLDSVAQFTVTATGAASYQWYYRKSSSDSWAETALSGCTTATLKVTAKSTRDGWQFRCKVSNAMGYVYTSAVKLTVTEKPVITAQPASKSASEGATVKFTVTAEGAASYQWYYRTSSSGSWQECSGTGAATATLTIEAKSFRNGYQYRCKVTNDKGYVYSSAATLTVN
ncbi:MAG: immunoglobulin domain-containing protein [Oscillospiraceae bacterium]|nr:immunoglobulin domain-containing protein [Oscillospiraceae bacterium]